MCGLERDRRGLVGGGQRRLEDADDREVDAVQGHGVADVLVVLARDVGAEDGDEPAFVLRRQGAPLRVVQGEVVAALVRAGNGAGDHRWDAHGDRRRLIVHEDHDRGRDGVDTIDRADEIGGLDRHRGGREPAHRAGAVTQA